MTPRAHRSVQGRGLLELLVTAVLLGMLSIAIMRLGPPMADGTRLLAARARDLTELRLALEYLLQDMGGAAEVNETVDGELHLVRTNALADKVGALVLGADAGILYALDDGMLVRTDLALGDVTYVARGVQTFSVSESTGVETTITLGAGEDIASTSVDLVWEW